MMGRRNYSLVYFWVWGPFILSLLISGLFLWQKRPLSLPAQSFPYENLLEDPGSKLKDYHQDLGSFPSNPFLFSEKKTKERPFRVHLTSIVQIGKKKVCLLNGRPYHQGESFFEGKILYIGKDSVILSWKEKEVRIRVGEELYL